MRRKENEKKGGERLRSVRRKKKKILKGGECKMHTLKKGKELQERREEASHVE
jgi:hypothetical protein